MQFKNPENAKQELTFDDVFLFQNQSDIASRFEVDVEPKNKLDAHLPIITANMNAISGKRMCETIARFGGLGCLPQDMSLETITRIVKHIKSANIFYDTPITVKKENTIRDALGLIKKRSHESVVLIDDNNKVLGIFTKKDFQGFDQYTYLGDVKTKKVISAKKGVSLDTAFETMQEHSVSCLPITDEKETLIGMLTKANTIRSKIYTPSVDANGNLEVLVALGINNFLKRAKALYKIGITKFVLDTAHGYQEKMLQAIKTMRAEFGEDIVLVAGNVSTKEGTRDLIQAGADGVKVGIGPGAMCTTRIKTGVGRPQFTAVFECASEAKKLGGFVVADGGIRNPRDLALSLAAGASFIMMGTVLTATYESTGDFREDSEGNLYKQNYGMASTKAVYGRNKDLTELEIAKKMLYQEGISNSKIYQKSGRESVGKIVDEFIMGLRSAMSYVGARTLEQFYEQAIIGVQTNAGFTEGTPHGKLVK